ncbi:M protein [Mycolicibacterium sp. Dal123E01]|uniref:M protein n=1 Tax=Mycolicibacterium sp. Dal123E01 TaxID=3457578 RepID=UPI00403E4C45
MPSDAHPPRQERESTSFELKRRSWQLDRHDSQVSELRAVAQPGESRMAILHDQLGRSQAELEAMSARFSEVASAIPDDIGYLGDRLSAILNAASTEADEIRVEARRLADTIRKNAEENAAGVLAEAQQDYQLANQMREDVEAQRAQALNEIARLREQAARDAAETVAEARQKAEETLIAVQRQVNAQVSAASTKLDELNHVRAKVVAQLKNFYDTFTRFEQPWGEPEPARAVYLTSASVEADESTHHGAHSALDVDSAHHSLGDVG